MECPDRSVFLDSDSFCYVIKLQNSGQLFKFNFFVLLLILLYIYIYIMSLSGRIGKDLSDAGRYRVYHSADAVFHMISYV